MNKKVLGFYEEDIIKIEPDDNFSYLVYSEKSVPVVSLKALKAWGKGKKHKPAHFTWQNLRNQLIDDLLSWAEKEAGKK